METNLWYKYLSIHKWLLFSYHDSNLLLQFILPYSVSKTALLGLVKALSHDIAQDNIRVNSVAPGLIDTSFSSAVSASNKTTISVSTIAHMVLSTFASQRILHSNDLHGNVDHPIGVKNHQKEIS